MHLGPKSFRPTIELDGNHVVFAVSPEAARAALAAVRRKDWKPSDDLAKVCENVADNLVLLGVNDVSDTLAALLASLPGTLQTLINTSLALAKAKARQSADRHAERPNASQPASRPAPAGASGMRPSVARRRDAGAAAARAQPGKAGWRKSGGCGCRTARARRASAGDSAIVFNIDAEKLPKASDLKSYLFPSTLTISVTDQDIRIVSREAFPDFASLFGACAGGGDDAGQSQNRLDRAVEDRPAQTEPRTAARRHGRGTPRASGRPGGRRGRRPRPES